MAVNFPGGIGRGKLLIPSADTSSAAGAPQMNGLSNDYSSAQTNSFGGSRGGFGASSGGGDTSSSTGFGASSGGGGFGASSGGGFGASSGGGFGGSSGGGFGGSSGGGGFGGGGGRSGGGGGRTCNICSEEGHIARECPTKGSGGGGRGSGNCFKCGQPGHRSFECTNAGGDGGRSGSGGGGFGSNNDGGFGSGGGGGGFGSGGGGGGFGKSEGGGFGDNAGGGGFGSSSGGGGGFGSGGGGSRACRNCNEEGHIARDCPTKQPNDGKCRKCQQEGHIARECPTGGGGGPGDGTGCRRCGSADHMVRDCPQPMKCFNCQQEGHQSKDCTNEPAPNPDGTTRKPPSTYQPKELTDTDIDNIQRIHTGINFDSYDKINVQVTGVEDAPQIERFEDAGLTETVLENLRKTNWSKPTPVQKRAIPIIMSGHDLMACAQTGSGKTAAYVLPVLTCMLKRNEFANSTPQSIEPTALIIAPTRELVIQICSEAKYFAKGTMITACQLYGGTNVRYQLDIMQRGCNILVATPGRLNQMIVEGRISLAKVRYIILDEADRMLDMGFESEIRKVAEHPTIPIKSDRQTLMFSATFPEEIQTLAHDFLRPQFAFVAVGIVGGANRDITQQFEQVSQYDKKDRLLELLREDLENSKLNSENKYSKKTLVFVERKRVADFVAGLLSQLELKATSIHGDREQKQREEALFDFKSGICPILIATAVAARGLDIVGVDHVINYDLPSSIDDYVHRIGRTGRVGNPGRATSFFDSSVDTPLAPQLLQILGDAQQIVPEWLQGYGSGVNSYGGGGRSTFGGTDLRSNDDGWESGAGAAANANAGWD